MVFESFGSSTFLAAFNTVIFILFYLFEKILPFQQVHGSILLYFLSIQFNVFGDGTFERELEREKIMRVEPS